MRFVKLTVAEIITLQEGHKNGSQFQFRNRCQCLLLSHQGKTVPELVKLFDINPITIYGWFDRWENGGICGLMNKPGRGRKPILSVQNPNHVKAVRRSVGKNAPGVKRIVAELEHTLDEKMSVQTVRRFLKNLVSLTEESAPRSARGEWVLIKPKKKRR
jgi:transposase